MITADNIQGLEFFDSISQDQAEKIAAIAFLTNYKSGDVIQAEGDDCTDFYFVHAGLVALEISMQQENHVTIDTIKPGELFGWSAFVPPHLVTAKSVCKEDVTVIQIPSVPFMEILRNDDKLRADIMERVLYIVANRLKDTRSQLNYLLAWN